MHSIYDGTYSYYDMGVAVVDCVTVIVYTLHVWGPLELLIIIVHWVIKILRRQQRWNLMVVFVALCSHIDP